VVEDEYIDYWGQVEDVFLKGDIFGFYNFR
jgi:hypothetical protein